MSFVQSLLFVLHALLSLHLTHCDMTVKSDQISGEETLHQLRNTANTRRKLATTKYSKDNTHLKLKTDNNKIEIVQYFTQTFASLSGSLMDAKQIKVYQKFMQSLRIDYGLNGQTIETACRFIEQDQQFKSIESSNGSGTQNISMIKVVFALKWSVYSDFALNNDVQILRQRLSNSYLDLLNILSNRELICAKIDELEVIQCSRASTVEIFTTASPTPMPTMELTLSPTMKPTPSPTEMPSVTPIRVQTKAPTISWKPTTTYHPANTWNPTRSWSPTQTWEPSITWKPSLTWKPIIP